MSDGNIQYQRTPSWWYILVTILLAVLLSIVPVPDTIEHYWPDWVTLVVFYWVLALPAHLGVMFGWMNGLLEDIVSFSLLGQHALGNALVGTVAAMAYKKFGLFNVLKKMFVILVVQSINIGIYAWTNHLAFSTPIEGVLWLPALSTALIWPLVSVLMDQFDPLLN